MTKKCASLLWKTVFWHGTNWSTCYRCIPILIGIFLDIDIETEGKRAGLDLACRIDRLPLPRLPWLVFTTGFEEYALAAHHVRPFSYLAKPINDANVAIVLDKIRKAEQQKALKQPQHRIEIKHRAMNRGETIWRTKLSALTTTPSKQN
jgi:DNA-binding LytR/AlgR family response regulator